MVRMIKYIKQNTEVQMLLCFQMIIFCLCYTSFYVENAIVVIVCYIFINVFSAGSFYCLYKISKTVSRHIELEVETSMYQRQQKMQQDHLQVYEENRRQSYEIRNQIIDELEQEPQSEQDAQKKANSLIVKYADLYMIDYCQNKLIDAILYNKALLAKSLHIKTNIQVNVPAKLAIKDIDLMFLFINLLDNAIEACEQVAKEDRFLTIEAMIQANYLVVTVINSKHPSVTVDAKTRLSTKIDKEHHGMGLSIIKHVCKQNNGMMKIVDNKEKVEIIATLAMEGKGK